MPLNLRNIREYFCLSGTKTSIMLCMPYYKNFPYWVDNGIPISRASVKLSRHCFTYVIGAIQKFNFVISEIVNNVFFAYLLYYMFFKNFVIFIVGYELHKSLYETELCICITNFVTWILYLSFFIKKYNW